MKAIKNLICGVKLLLFLIVTLGINNFTLGKEIKVSNLAEFKSALKIIKPGESIIMANGEWKDINLIFNANGTKDNPITLKAETPGEVILTGSSKLRIGGNYLVVDGLYFKNGEIDKGSVIEFRKDSKTESNNCRLTNSVMINYNPPGDEIEYKWVSLYGTNNRVDHCYFRGKTNEGCLLVVWLSDKPNYHLIDHNYFGDRPKLGRNGAEIIRVGTSEWSQYPSYTTVEENYFEHCDGEVEIISNKSCFNVYRHNTFVECKGALTLRHGNDCTVEGNFFFCNRVKGTGGIRIIGERHKVINNYIEGGEGKGTYAAISFMEGVPNSPINRYFQVKDAIVTFNTLVDNKYSIEIGAGKNDELKLPPVNSAIANNIVYSMRGELVTETDKPQNFKWDGNIFFGTKLGIEKNSGIKIIDPKLEKNEDGIYRPSDLSPAINTAVGEYDYVTEDIDGQKRSEPKDVGCDEKSNLPIIFKPLKPSDVGPIWKVKND